MTLKDGLNCLAIEVFTRTGWNFWFLILLIMQVPLIGVNLFSRAGLKSGRKAFTHSSGY